MINYITVDGGTTNTRIYLVQGGKVVDYIKCGIGATAGKSALCETLKSGIAKLLCDNNLAERNIEKVLLSGMITSEFGLYELPHLQAPVGIKELHDSMQEVAFPEISSIPFVFIRGIKCDSDSIGEFDMMRGEETELMGLMALCGSDSHAVYVLPGSHSKIVSVDKSGRIYRFSTMLTGEMLMALSQNTILKDAVDITVDDPDGEYLLKGYDYSKIDGLNKALFKVRILKSVFKKSPSQVYGFFLGAILADEIDNILCSDAKTVIIGGNRRIKNPTAAMLESMSSKSIITVSDGDVERSTAIGAIKIFEYK
jgi:2-dehydro-3-deoxygalactonokinase